ncbi:MAG TPA: radical SAM protein [bacterium]|nr:radical SAM protein [bacterium]
MKVVFVYPAFESLAIEYLAAVAREKNHEVRMVFDPRLFADSFVQIPSLARFFSMRDRVIEEVVGHQPDLIAFSVVTNDFPWFKEIGAEIRRHTSAPIIAGNIHVTSVPEQVLRLGFVDAVIRGEGEGAFADILDSIEETGEINPGIENVATLDDDGNARINPLRRLIQDLDTLPFPDKTIYDGTSIKARDIYTIMTTRGCPYTCSFCNNNLLKRLYGIKGYLRSRSVDNSIAELKQAVENFGPGHVNFYDEVFGTNKRWLREFVDKYKKEIGLPYIACTNPNIVDEEYADLLAESGCGKLDMGVQTINPEKRRHIYHRRETNEQIRYAIDTLKSRGIKVAAENITNFPTETEENLLEMARFYNETRPSALKVFWLRYYPGTEIVDIAVEKGVLTREDVERVNQGEDLGSVTIGVGTPVLQRKFYPMFALTQVLPGGMVELMLDRKLYRYFPASIMPKISYTLYRLLTRRSPEEEIMMYQHARRYVFYLKKWASGIKKRNK